MEMTTSSGPSQNQTELTELEATLSEEQIRCEQNESSTSNRIWDSWVCWDETSAGTNAYAPCPHFVTGFDPNRMAYKECLPDGTWFRHPLSNRTWSNYTTCVDLPDLARRQVVTTIYEVGYLVSLCALIISLVIFCSFRCLECTRVRIHKHLFVSFIINNILWLVWYRAVMNPSILGVASNEIDWEQRVKLADDLTASLRNVSPQVLLKNLSQTIPLVSNIAAESHFRVSLSILNTIMMLGDRLRDCKMFLGPKSIQNADLTWLIRRLCTVCGESRSTLRTEGALALSRLIKGAGPELVCEPLYQILSSESKKSSGTGRLTAGPRIKAAAIDALTFALLTFPRDEFDLPVLGKHACKSLWNTKRRVRQAALECLAVVAHALGPSTAMPMFRTYIEQTKYAVMIPQRTLQQASQGNLGKMSGSIGALDPVLTSGSGKMGNRHSAMIGGADISWILSGTGPIQTSTLYSPSHNLDCQNNAMDIYGDFFEETWQDPDSHRQPPYAHVIEVYRDPSATKRPVSRITWAPDNVGRVGICHCPLEFDTRIRQQPTEAFLWDLENSSRPEGLVRAGTHIVDMRYNPKDMHRIIGGCFDGSVCVWDARVGANPVDSSDFEHSHGDICTGVMWINSKTGTEFFSTGLDGQVIWWDDRKLSEVIDSTWLDPEKGQCRPDHALGASVLEYEHTLPTKFMAGTETGEVMIMMRKGKTPNDKLVHVYHAHHGPVRGLQRNPTFIKNFLTVGDHTCRIFAEDCRESSILWTAPKTSLYSHGAWIPTRASSFCCCRLDGNLDFWDMLMDPVRPHLSSRVCDDSLTTVSPADSGKFVAVGTDQGYMSLVKLADSMTTSEKSEKPILAAIFERESRREKVLEARNREIRLRKRDKEKAETEKKKVDEEREKQREAALAQEKETGKRVPLPDLSGGKKFDIVYETKTDPVVQAEREFFQSLRMEMESAGVNAFPDKKIPENADEGESRDRTHYKVEHEL